MAGVKFVEYNGKKILSIDLANADLETIAKVTKEVKHLIEKEPEKSVLTLTNITNVSIGFGSIKILKELVVSNKPYVIASAVIGLSSAHKIQLDLIMKFSGRTFPTFNTFEEAVQWLVSEKT